MAPKTMRKIWKDAGIPSRKRPKKHVTKNNLRHVKKLFKLFERNGEDTKDLFDIPEYLLPDENLKLGPESPIHFSGKSPAASSSWASPHGRSLTHAELFAVYINHFLKKFNALPDKASIRQTDNGSEYIGAWNAKKSSAYTRAIESLDGSSIAQSSRSPQNAIGHRNHPHNLMEANSMKLVFKIAKTSLAKHPYTTNCSSTSHRPNSYKENKTP